VIAGFQLRSSGSMGMGRLHVGDVVCVRWGDVGARQGSEERRLGAEVML
jgi:hypothetical protein